MGEAEEWWREEPEERGGEKTLGPDGWLAASFLGLYLSEKNSGQTPFLHPD